LGEVVDGLGYFDWQTRHGLFWDRVYGYLARCAGMNSPSELKSLCISRRGSPIVFENCSPQPILNSGVGKAGVRRTYASEVRAYIRDIFMTLDEGTPGRLCLVALSVGPDFQLYVESRSALEHECRIRGIPLLDLPYLGSRASNNELYARIGTRDAGLLSDLMAEFVNRSAA
jgi:hypothetical protein